MRSRHHRSRALSSRAAYVLLYIQVVRRATTIRHARCSLRQVITANSPHHVGNKGYSFLKRITYILTRINGMKRFYCSPGNRRSAPSRIWVHVAWISSHRITSGGCITRSHTCPISPQITTHKVDARKQYTWSGLRMTSGAVSEGVRLWLKLRQRWCSI